MPHAKGSRPVPASPDSLETGIRGKITGVTRIGPRALGIGALTLFLIISLIMIGANKQQARRSVDTAAVQYAAPAPADTAHFGADEPIAVTAASLPAKATPDSGAPGGPPIPAGLVLTTPTPAPAPPPVTATNASVPNIETAPGAPANVAPVAQPTVDAVAQARAQRLAMAEQRRAQAAAEKAAELTAAHEAPILVGERKPQHRSPPSCR